jgi:type II secretory pathway pseudopilin PulG
VVIAIIAVLIAILLPSLGKAREQAKRGQCGSKLRALAQATLMYTQGNADTFPAPASSGASYDYDWVAWTTADLALPSTNRRSLAQRGVGPYMNLNLSNNMKLLVCPSDEDAPRRATAGGYRYTYSINWNMTSAFPNSVSFQSNREGKCYTKLSNVKNRDVIFFAEESNPDDGNGAYWHANNYLSFINIPSPRHDARKIRKLPDTMTNNQVPNGNAQCVVAFIDGHVEWITRKVACIRKSSIGNLQDFPIASNPDPIFP